MHQFETFLG